MKVLPIILLAAFAALSIVSTSCTKTNTITRIDTVIKIDTFVNLIDTPLASGKNMRIHMVVDTSAFNTLNYSGTYGVMLDNISMVRYVYYILTTPAFIYIDYNFNANSGDSVRVYTTTSTAGLTSVPHTFNWYMYYDSVEIFTGHGLSQDTTKASVTYYFP